MGVDFTGLVLRPISKDDDLSNFDSASDDLNEFLKNDAIVYENELVGKTYVCTAEEKIVGYMTLLVDSIKVEIMHDEDVVEEIKHRVYPALKIGRLAVDKRYERKGIGTFLVMAAIGKARELSKTVGCRFVIVDAKQNSIDFYKRMLFKLMKKSTNRIYPTMYFDLFLRTKGGD